MRRRSAPCSEEWTAQTVNTFFKFDASFRHPCASNVCTWDITRPLSPRGLGRASDATKSPGPLRSGKEISTWTRPSAIYIHIPFCASKCSYCDFYSLAGCDRLMPKYQDALVEHIRESYGALKSRLIDTVYFGGGTPSYYGANRLLELWDELRGSGSVLKDCEVTVEVNPDSAVYKDLAKLRKEASTASPWRPERQQRHTQAHRPPSQLEAGRDGHDSRARGGVRQRERGPHLRPAQPDQGRLGRHADARDRAQARTHKLLRPHAGAGHAHVRTLQRLAPSCPPTTSRQTCTSTP